MKRRASRSCAPDSKRQCRASSAPPPSRLPQLWTDFNPKDYFDLVPTKISKWRKGPIVKRSYIIKGIKDLETPEPLLKQVQLSKILESAFNDMLKTIPSGSKAQVVADNPLFNKKVIATCMTNAKDLTFHHLADRINAVMQSDEFVNLSGTTFTLSTYKTPTVGARGRTLSNRLDYEKEDFARYKRSLYDPCKDKRNKNCKGLCVPLILAKELEILEKNIPKEGLIGLRNYLASRPAKEKAIKLVEQAGLLPKEGPFTLDQLKEFAKCLPGDVSLNFFDSDSPPFIKVKKPGNRSINIFILSNEDENAPADFHAYGINNLRAFMGAGNDRKTQGVCPKCFKAHSSEMQQGHKCPEAGCQQCKYLNCLNKNNKETKKKPYHCSGCNVCFKTQGCKDAHCCGDLIRCNLCGETNRKRDADKHPCGKNYCQTCQRRHHPREFCVVHPESNSEKKPKNIWYADMESQIRSDGEHHPNLLIIQRSDGKGYKEYKNNALEQFNRDCIKKNSPYKDSYVVWHNASGYDAHLWYHSLCKIGAHPKSIIKKGQKILSMELAQNGIICRDSLQFVPGTPLAAFPKMFGLKSGPKGDFPHGLNTPAWIKFNGTRTIYREIVDEQVHTFPLLKYFWPEKKTAEQVIQLKTWHQEQVKLHKENPVMEYCPEEELLKYCRQDVEILCQGFEEFRKTLLEQYPDVEPLDSLTFPSYNNKIFRNYYMPKDSLCLLPPEGYSSSKASRISLAYLAWMEKKMGLQFLRTGRQGGEVWLGGHPVDGYGIDSQGQVHVFNFHGCVWHAHDLSKCTIKQTRFTPDQMEEKRARTIRTDEKLLQLSAGNPYGAFTYHTIFECAFRRLMKNNKEVGSFVYQYEKYYNDAGDPLKPRDAMRGGRTNVIKHVVDPVPPGYQLHYLDFTSLYPAVNASINGEQWPTGHPEIFIGKDLENGPGPGEWFGLAKVTIIPPRGLLHPVLPQKTESGKVLYHLCTACASEEQESPCMHQDSERAIKDTFFTKEIDLAIEQGYSLVKVHELWHWPQEQRSQTLFRNLILDQFKKKVLASPKPQDPVMLQELLQNLLALGISVEEQDWDENKAMRALAKFILNNIWGFLGKRNDMEETTLVKTFSEFLAIENHKNKEICNIHISDDEETLLVTHKPIKEKPGKNQNIVLAVLTTAYARMALYRVIQEYPKEVVYFDTDSVFLLLPPGMPPPPTSSSLGGLKDEILEEFGPGAKITRFASIGPKSYTYMVEQDGKLVKEVTKLKGICMTSEVKLDGEAIKDIATNKGTLTVNQHTIRRDFFKASLRNRELLKEIGFSSTKRCILPPPNYFMDTVPFGY